MNARQIRRGRLDEPVLSKSLLVLVGVLISFREQTMCRVGIRRDRQQIFETAVGVTGPYAERMLKAM